MSIQLRPCELPPTALLQPYRRGSGFADCYVTEVDGHVSQAAFVEAFYTTPLFKVERVILKWFAGSPSTDLGARSLAEGMATTFAAWKVEGRTPNQLLLADLTGRTRSWLMAEPATIANTASATPGTLLYFGSAVLPRGDRGADGQRMSVVFQALLGFHRLYSRLLLRAARARVLRVTKESTLRANENA